MTAGAAGRPAVFFDRDGVLNVDRGYAHLPEQIEWMPGAIGAVRSCNEAGYLVFVVTNQAGVAHGYYPESDVERLHAWMLEELLSHGARVDAFEYCPHHPDARLTAYRRICNCRKPGAGMVARLVEAWSVDPSASFLIGDKPTDLGAAHAAGIRGFLYAGGPVDAFVDSCRASIGLQSPGSGPQAFT